MPSLDYSLSAINVLKKFHRADVLVFVEGDDDLPFWRAVFSNFCSKMVAIHPVGSGNEVNKYARRIVDDGADIVVARDSDYLRLTGGVVVHDRVIYTIGHSIENSVFVPMVIKKICHLTHRRDAPDERVVADWLKAFSTDLEPLIILDAAAQMEGVGVSFIGSNCSRYMVSSKSEKVSVAKVRERLDEVGSGVSVESVKEVTEAMARLGVDVLDFVRGHVLCSAVIRFISKFSRKNVSSETVFTGAMSIFEAELGRAHPHRDYYKSAVDAAIMSSE